MIFQCDFSNLHFYPQWIWIAIIPNTSQHLELPVFLYLAIWWVCRTPVCNYQLITNEVRHCIICCHLGCQPRYFLPYRGEARGYISKNFLFDSGWKSEKGRKEKVIFSRGCCSHINRQTWDCQQRLDGLLSTALFTELDRWECPCVLYPCSLNVYRSF